MKKLSLISLVLLAGCTTTSTENKLNDNPQATLLSRNTANGNNDATGSNCLGDTNADGLVNFDDITIVLANWLCGTNNPGYIPPSLFPINLVVKVYPMAIEELENPPMTMIILKGTAADVMTQLNIPVSKLGGIRGISWPASYPPWPEPGSKFEELILRWPEDHNDIEAVATRILEELNNE